MKLEKLGFAKWFIIAAGIALVSTYLVPRIPLSGLVLGGALVVSAFVLRKHTPKGIPIATILGVSGALIIVNQFISGGLSTMKNIASPQAITQRQRADPVAKAFL